jgi:signal transduction histidine kinase
MDEYTARPTSTETEAANQHARDVFLAVKRHDLRTPINAIIGYSEMMLEDLEDEEFEWSADLEKIHDAGKSLLTTVNEMLNAEKLESGDIDTSDMAAFGEQIRVAVRADISSVVGYSEMISEDEEDLDEEIIADLERIRSSAVRMTGLVNDIADFGTDDTESDAEGEAMSEQAGMVHDLVATLQDLDASKWQAGARHRTDIELRRDPARHHDAGDGWFRDPASPPVRRASAPNPRDHALCARSGRQHRPVHRDGGRRLSPETLRRCVAPSSAWIIA